MWAVKENVWSWKASTLESEGCRIVFHYNECVITMRYKAILVHYLFYR